jgi:hypothetical protein
VAFGIQGASEHLAFLNTGYTGNMGDMGDILIPMPFDTLTGLRLSMYKKLVRFFGL